MSDDKISDDRKLTVPVPAGARPGDRLTISLPSYALLAAAEARGRQSVVDQLRRDPSAFTRWLDVQPQYLSRHTAAGLVADYLEAMSSREAS